LLKLIEWTGANWWLWAAAVVIAFQFGWHKIALHGGRDVSTVFIEHQERLRKRSLATYQMERGKVP